MYKGYEVLRSGAPLEITSRAVGDDQVVRDYEALEKARSLRKVRPDLPALGILLGGRNQFSCGGLRFHCVAVYSCVYRDIQNIIEYICIHNPWLMLMHLAVVLSAFGVILREFWICTRGIC